MEGAPSKDLLIVGPGVLGSYLGKLWKDNHPGSRVIGQTNSTANHTKLEELGLEPRTKDDADSTKFPFVVFSAPPSGSSDYAAEVRAALELWDGSGSFVFTSSGGVYAPDSGDCDESSPVVPLGQSERQDRLLLSEQAVLEAGGNVIRYVGLYHARRGAHTFFYMKGEIERSGDYVVNLIHYEDAADMARAVLEGSGSDSMYRGEIFVGSDDTPVTFADMIAACDATGKFDGSVKFTGSGGPPGKRMTSKASKEKLQWKPKYSSFAEFMQTTGASDFYTQ